MFLTLSCFFNFNVSQQSQHDMHLGQCVMLMPSLSIYDLVWFLKVIWFFAYCKYSVSNLDVGKACTAFVMFLSFYTVGHFLCL